MMVMRRRAGESILIGNDIEIHIAETGRSRVKIAINAPREIPIVAKELKITAEENAAAVAAEVPAFEALAGRLRRFFLKTCRPSSMSISEPVTRSR